MAQGRDDWPGKAAVSYSTRGSPQRDQLKSAPEWVVGLGIPASSLLLCPLPSWLSFQQWGSTAHPHCHLSVHKSAVGSPCRVAGSWSCRSAEALHTLAFPPVLSRPYCVLSWRDCGSLLPLLLPGSPKGGNEVGLRALAGAALSICSFLENQGRCRRPYDVAGK